MRPIKDALHILSGDHTKAQKANYLKYVISKKKERLDYKPVVVSVVATGRCTLSCDMCPTHSAVVPKTYPHIQKNVHDIEFEMFKDIVDRFSEAVSMQLIGSGEPLLNRDIFAMIDYAAGKKMTVKTFSNGTTIGQNIDNILRSRLQGITISINGHDAAEFTRMTGMDGKIYGMIRDATRTLIKERDRSGSKVKVKISHIIDKQNYRAIPQMIRLSLDMGSDHVFLCNFLPSPYEGLTAQERVLEAEEDVISDIRSMINSLSKPDLKKVTFPTLVDRRLGAALCDSHFSQIRFDGDGNVSSCSMMLLNMTGQGNCKDENVWNNDFFRSMRKKFITGLESLPEPCRHCSDNVGSYPWLV